MSHIILAGLTQIGNPPGDEKDQWLPIGNRWPDEIFGLVESVHRHRRITRLTRADADRLLDRGNEDLAVTNLAGVGALDDHACNALGLSIVHDDFDFHLRQEINGVFGSTVNLGVAFLTTKALDFRNCHSLHTHLGEGFFDFFKFEWFDDPFDFFHSSVD